MRPKSFALLALALGCGLVASIGITQVMAKRSGETVEVTAETQNVYVAVKDIGASELLAPEMLKLEPWPKDKVPPNAATKPEDLEGRLTKVKFYSGEPILKNKLIARGERSEKAGVNIPKGMRVVSVKVDSVSGTASLIEPGDRVDLICHFQPNPAAGVTAPTTRTILQNVKVFAIDNVISVEKLDDGKSTKAQTVSLQVTPEQAQKVTLATELGMVRLVLRSPDDAESPETASVSSQMLLGIKAEANKFEKDEAPTEKATPEFIKVLKEALGPKLPAVTAEPVPAKEQYSVRVLSGSKFTESTFEKSSDSSGAEHWKPTGQSDLAVATGGGSNAAATAAAAATPPAGPAPTEPSPSAPEGGKR